MESTSPQVPFPLVKAWVDYEYRPCTIPYRFPSDPPQATRTELIWIQVFRKSIPSFKKVAEQDDSVVDAPTRAAKFAERYGKMLDELEADPFSNGGPPDAILLTRLREICLREVGFSDIYKNVKDEENTKCLALFPDVVKTADNIEDVGERIEHLMRGVFAGNIFDLGASQLAEKFAEKACSFEDSCQQLLPRPWVIDDLDQFKQKWLRKPWKKAVIFVDNSGSDVILGILPFARELLRRGTKVVLAANDLPSINDITYDELKDIVAKLKDGAGKDSILGVNAHDLFVVNSGSDLPVLDLSHISPELAYACEDADLVVLEGMGRAIETNLYAQFKCDSLKVGMVKHQEVAEFLGGRLYDCVIKFNEVIL
ncbi:type II pantothenate kinase [Marchantia polymorpha subsp. ruderalis]|uniref:Damage-control phosphatase ARMT1-like metal-binding domain-containing protein n=1 Tax=Marchantia polymorpha TaxID=3197 RepID=A0A2R6XDQ8_MARPO|nr:hypothetical protein MARPO_0021s0096 [Marchantia polymorpha]BBN01315.1 hypothetical protein Mp_2g06410 [Marchantia polymorpha subsp. ruderalis]|eukprot:PTQ44240.1 hypothetical protein MARPO_0021s0096 [Marchantia polymorpha]